MAHDDLQWQRARIFECSTLCSQYIIKKVFHYSTSEQLSIFGCCHSRILFFVKKKCIFYLKWFQVLLVNQISPPQLLQGRKFMEKIYSQWHQTIWLWLSCLQPINQFAQNFILLAHASDFLYICCLCSQFQLTFYSNEGKFGFFFLVMHRCSEQDLVLEVFLRKILFALIDNFGLYRLI